ncbi:NADH-quinone oxidoreductase subunit A [Saccharopolyspora cebuensis]|uniref:NADH-quinone oxidoreductase subunit A n=1 Tax=Saccharopolyspora cebuensis TaxID=418759 RepID=UPI0033718810
MSGFAAAGALLLVGVAVVVGLYAVARVVAVGSGGSPVAAFQGGAAPGEHAFSRFHVRWYVVSMIYLAFEVEMVFMYPWALVVTSMGAAAVVEMFLFLGVLVVGVLYAWREGAFEWT